MLYPISVPHKHAGFFLPLPFAILICLKVKSIAVGEYREEAREKSACWGETGRADARGEEVTRDRCTAPAGSSGVDDLLVASTCCLVKHEEVTFMVGESVAQADRKLIAS